VPARLHVLLLQNAASFYMTDIIGNLVISCVIKHATLIPTPLKVENKYPTLIPTPLKVENKHPTLIPVPLKVENKHPTLKTPPLKVKTNIQLSYLHH